MLSFLKKRNTLRNQILIVFLIVMIFVFSIVSIITFQIVSSMLQDNAERQIQQTAVQASGRMEALYEQVELLSSQVSTNINVQELLLKELDGYTTNFEERQYLMQVVDLFLAYTKGIESFELYLNDGDRILPLNHGNLYSVVDRKWIEKADENKGEMVFAGEDPWDENYYLAIKQVTLLERWFSPGGYLVARVKQDYLSVEDSQDQGEYIIVLDQESSLISSNFDGDHELILNESRENIIIDDEEYMLVSHHSEITGWETIFLTPVSTVTKDVSVLRTALMIAVGLGCVLFIVVTYPLSTMITRPIQKLTETMRDGSAGALKENPSIPSTIEIDELNATYNTMVGTMNHLIQVVYEKELHRSRAELKALQAQINPHFLFNTLEALYWDLLEKGEDELSEYVLDMADLFRYTISNSQKEDWVTLKEEITHVERYMRIMKIRFEDRLTWKVNMPKEFEIVEIPKLIIQPIVENAILHGIGNKVGVGSVEVNVRPEDWNGKGYLVIEVKDDGAGMEEGTLHEVTARLTDTDTNHSVTTKHGMALVNVNQRLRLSFPDDGQNGIKLESALGKGTCVFIRLPLNG
ncbi:sensor histidine kinase [Litchfieldia alkalitelluris]|nr:sensor histidine kinase [Litchfieldia alkalitelluris]